MRINCISADDTIIAGKAIRNDKRRVSRGLIDVLTLQYEIRASAKSPSYQLSVTIFARPHVCIRRQAHFTNCNRCCIRQTKIQHNSSVFRSLCLSFSLYSRVYVAINLAPASLCEDRGQRLFKRHSHNATLTIRDFPRNL